MFTLAASSSSPPPAKKKKKKKVSFCNSNAGCPNGPGAIVPANSCVLKHVEDIHNPEEFGTGQPSHTWRSATVDKAICVSQFGRRLAST